MRRWCHCGKCAFMPTREQNVCCRNHDAASARVLPETQCITENPGVEQLLQEAPLEMAYNQYLVYHGM